MSGRSEIGGVPKVMQWMRLKPLKLLATVCMYHDSVRHDYVQPVKVLSSDFTCSASM